MPIYETTTTRDTRPLRVYRVITETERGIISDHHILARSQFQAADLTEHWENPRLLPAERHAHAVTILPAQARY